MEQIYYISINGEGTKRELISAFETLVSNLKLEDLSERPEHEWEDNTLMIQIAEK